MSPPRIGDAVEEAAEVALDERVQVGGRDALGEPAVAADVDEEHGHVALVLVEPGRVRVGEHEAADRRRHELGEVIAHPGQIAEAVVELALPGQRPLDAGHQLALVHRLGQHVVRPVLEQLHPVLDGGERGHHDHRDEPRGLALAEPAADREAVHDRHHDVQEDQVRRVGGGPLDGLGPVLGGGGHVAEPVEDVLEIPDDVRLVVDHEHLEVSRHQPRRESSRQTVGPAYPAARVGPAPRDGDRALRARLLRRRLAERGVAGAAGVATEVLHDLLRQRLVLRLGRVA